MLTLCHQICFAVFTTSSVLLNVQLLIMVAQDSHPEHEARSSLLNWNGMLDDPSQMQGQRVTKQKR
jgi:hypothetical protein